MLSGGRVAAPRLPHAWCLMPHMRTERRCRRCSATAPRATSSGRPWRWVEGQSGCAYSVAACAQRVKVDVPGACCWLAPCATHPHSCPSSLALTYHP